MEKKKWQLAIYDFNGTLINDGVLAYRCVEHIFKTLRPDIAPPTFEEYKNEITSNFTKFYYDHGILESVSGEDMNRIRVPFYETHSNEIRLNDGAKALLEFCVKNQMRNAMVSASPENVRKMLKQFKILHLFEDIAVGVTSKTEALTATLDFFGTKAEDAFYLDDTFSGLSSAKKLGMGTVGFTEGYNSEARIRAAKPDFVVNSLAHVIKILENQRRGVN